MTVMNAMTQQAVQHAQLLATLVKNNVFGGGNSAPQIPWGDLLGNSLEMLGNFGAAWSEKETIKAKASLAQAQAAAAAAAQQAPSMAGLPQQPVHPRQPPQQPQQPQPPQTRPVRPAQPQPQPQQVVEVNPLAAFIAAVNQSVAAQEDPAKVADKIAAVVHAAQAFGATEKKVSGALRSLTEDPLKFLKKAYATADSAYLEKIARLLIEQFGVEEEDKESKDEESKHESKDEQAATPPTAPTETPSQEPQDESQQEQAAQAAPVAKPPPPTPRRRRTRKPKPNATEQPVEATAPAPASVPSEGGNGRRRGRRRRDVQLPLPDETTGTPVGDDVEIRRLTNAEPGRV